MAIESGAAEPGDDDSRSRLLAAARAVLGAEVRPLAGGFSGETFLVELPGESAVLRLYVRDPERAAVDVALSRLLRGLVPAPQVLDWRPPSAAGLGAFVLSEQLPGAPLDLVLATADAEQASRLGADVGKLLARLSGIPFLRPGVFAGSELAVEPMPPAALDLEAWMGEHLDRPPLDSWPDDVRRGLVAAAARGAHHLDAVDRTCLVHSDFNPKNVLVDADAGTVTGLVDWEYAHAGWPVTDLGNLLRFLDPGPFTEEVLAALRAAAPPLPPYLVETAAAADLFALTDLATRPVVHEIVRKARARLRAIGGVALD